MGEAQELQLHIREQADPAPSPPKEAPFAHPQSPPSKLRNWQWWFLLFFYSLLILAGQTSGTLLGRFYYNQGGKSLWIATLFPSSGFPLLIPLLLLLPPSPSPSPSPSASKLAATYISIGLLVTGDNLLYAYGLLYLPVSTFSLVCATQLAFNAAFSFFLNSQKFTPFVLNSIILLTLAAALLGVHSEGGSVTGDKYALGLTLTLAASAGFSLILSLTQLAFQKVVKAESFRVVLEMILWTGLVSTAAAVVGLFAGGEWRGVREEFEKDRVSYLMTLIWIAICWLVYSVGTVGLIFLVSSLFANVIGTVGLPLVPIFAVVFFRDRMDGVKVVALLIAVLGFVNYVYQHYLDDAKKRRDERP